MSNAAIWAGTDAEAREPGERTGLDTLVVPAVNDGREVWVRKHPCRSKRIKRPAWGVRPQGYNSKELTGARTSSGACGLIRSNAKNLTWA